MAKTLHLPVPPLAGADDPRAAALTRFEPVVQRALAKAPGERYASALEMREALTQAAARPVPHALSAQAMQWLQPGRTPADKVLPVLHDAVTAIDARLQREAQAVLARLAGPIAGLLVRRAASQAVTREQFVARLAALSALAGVAPEPREHALLRATLARLR
jgi:predicted membrane-bound spermidine synthase